MSVNTQHKDYQANLSTWKLMRDVISSNVTSYVPKLEGQDNDEYKAYVNRPAFFNATSRTLEALLGLIFSKPAEVPDSTELNKIYEAIKELEEAMKPKTCGYRDWETDRKSVV